MAPPELVSQAGGRPQLRGRRGAPADFGSRLARAEAIARTPATDEALEFVTVVLRHQRARAGQSSVRAAASRVGAASVVNRLVETYPVLALEALVEPVLIEIPIAVEALGGAGSPDPLEHAGEDLTARLELEGRELVETWIDDPALVNPRFGAWIAIAATPVLELAAAEVEPPSKAEWSGAACPACGGVPQVSVIREESGEFMAGSPRYLVCGRCALWWGFPRATCPWCGENDSKKVGAFSPEGQRWVRIDACDSCLSYMKAFDLRDPGARDVVPLVDDVATLTLDVWAHERGLRRPSVSLAGV